MRSDLTDPHSEVVRLPLIWGRCKQTRWHPYTERRWDRRWKRAPSALGRSPPLIDRRRCRVITPGSALSLTCHLLSLLSCSLPRRHKRPLPRRERTNRVCLSDDLTPAMLTASNAGTVSMAIHHTQLQDRDLNGWDWNVSHLVNLSVTDRIFIPVGNGVSFSYIYII